MSDSIETALAGLRVAVTGGTSGLGLALVRELHARGARVAFVARDARARRSASRARLPGAHGIVGDVSRKDDIHPIALQISAQLGGLDVLVNNASALGPVPLRAARRHRLRGPRSGARHQPARPVPPDQGAARRAGGVGARGPRRAVVLNISSDAAVNAYPRWGAYGASKAALRHLTRIWDEELADRRRALPRRSIRATWTRRCTRSPCPTPTRRR